MNEKPISPIGVDPFSSTRSLILARTDKTEIEPHRGHSYRRIDREIGHGISSSSSSGSNDPYYRLFPVATASLTSLTLGEPVHG